MGVLPSAVILRHQFQVGNLVEVDPVGEIDLGAKSPARKLGHIAVIVAVRAQGQENKVGLEVGFAEQVFLGPALTVPGSGQCVVESDTDPFHCPGPVLEVDLWVIARLGEDMLDDLQCQALVGQLAVGVGRAGGYHEGNRFFR